MLCKHLNQSMIKVMDVLRGHRIHYTCTCKELDRESSHFDDFCSTLFLCRFDNNNKQKEKK